jgi:RNA polymerase sigma-70 factor, ECF subfamily
MTEMQAAVAAAQAGDEAAFSALVDRHRRELQVHCYRMLGSFEDSEDAVQETFLRAWRRRETYAGRSTFRAWLYRIATNTCLDALERRPRVPAQVAPDAIGAPSEITWLQPFPDAILDAAAPSRDEPDAVVVAKETIELAFLVALQHLPPRSRAVLIVRDVLGWSAKETAELLDTSVAAVNSALQRARAALEERLPEQRDEWTAATEPDAAERALLERYVEASERGDGAALAALMAEDARFSMPPQPEAYRGRDTIVQAWISGGFGSAEFGHMRCLVTRANRSPAVACYVRGPGDDRHRAFALDALRIVEGEIAEITTFPADVFPAFGLPAEL